MSVWAQSWAYEQRLGKWRENKKTGEQAWKGDPGAKSVLAAASTFADENGYLFAGQDTLAEMCDMTTRTVREHLYNLEHAYGKIRRKERRGKDGEYTSDGMWLLAPKSRLRPPRSSDESDDSPPAEKFSVGEKRTDQRKSLPPDQRKSLPPNRQLVEPSGEPSENDDAREGDGKGKVHTSKPKDYSALIDEVLDGDPDAEIVREIMDLRAAENASGRMSFRKLYVEVVEPYAEWRDGRARLNGSPLGTVERRHRQSAMHEALTSDKPNMNWVKKAARSHSRRADRSMSGKRTSGGGENALSARAPTPEEEAELRRYFGVREPGDTNGLDVDFDDEPDERLQNRETGVQTGGSHG